MTTATTADTGTDTTTSTDDDTSADAGTTASTTASTTDAATDTGTDTAAEIAKWKALARKHEAESKANKKAREELDAINAAAMSDQEKAVKTAAETARAEGRTETLKEVGGKLATAAIRVAAADRMTKSQLNALLEHLDATKFLDDDGDPNEEAIQKWVDRVAPAAADDGKPSARRDLGQGARGQAVTTASSDPLEEHLRSVLGV